MVGAVIRGRRQILRVSLRQQLLHAGNEFKQRQIAPPMRDVWRNTIRRLKINQLRTFDFHEFTDRLSQVAEPLTVPRPRLKLWIPERKPDAFVARHKLSTFFKPSHKTRPPCHLSRVSDPFTITTRIQALEVPVVGSLAPACLAATAATAGDSYIAGPSVAAPSP